MTDWRKLALENEERIKEKMREAFEESIGDVTDSWQYLVQLEDDGTISIHFLSQNSSTGEVFDGEAVEVCRFSRFSIDNMDSDWNLENWLTDEERREFEAWKEKTGSDDIKEWNQEVYNRIIEERRQDFIDIYTESNVDLQWDQFMEKLENINKACWRKLEP